MKSLKLMIPAVLIVLFICGCAGRQKELLNQDYTVMNNDELLRYYYELSDEINRCVNESNRASVGVGTGYGISRLGVWLGLSRGISTCNPDQLRQRRIDVRIELQRRGLTP